MIQSQLAFSASRVQFLKRLGDLGIKPLEQENWREKLESDTGSRVSDPAQRVFAVFDGAVLDNPAYEFSKRQLFARPLFGGNTPQDFINSGPWLIDLYHAPPKGSDNPTALEPCDPVIQVRSLIKLAADKPALVFWIGGPDLTAEHLFKHLRSINKVLIPKEDGEPGEQEAVLFRHADGNVLASVLPALDEYQFARLFGPALVLTFHAPDFSDEDGRALRRAVHTPGGPPASVGMLTIRPDQMRTVEAGRIERLKHRLGIYLVNVAAESAQALPRWSVDLQIDESVRSALSMGLKLEASFRRWTYLMHVSQGRVGRQSEVMAFIRDGKTPLHVEKSGKPVPDNPDARMKAAFEQTIAYFKQSGSNPPRGNN